MKKTLSIPSPSLDYIFHNKIKILKHKTGKNINNQLVIGKTTPIILMENFNQLQV